MKSIISKEVETKYFDQYSSGSIPVAGSLTLVSDITRGNEVTQRVSNQIQLKHLSLRFTTNIHPSAINSYTRVLLVLDKMGMNAPTIAEILEPLYLSSPFTAVAPYQWDYRKRFKILYDQKVLLTQAAFTASCLSAEVGINVPSFHIGASTTFKNQVYLIILSTEQNILALPGYYWQTRLTYTDE